MASSEPWTCVVFDLDGTLVDSAAGVISSVELAFRGEGLMPPDRSELRKWLGPPMIDNLRSLSNLDDDEVTRILARYRNDYDTRGVLTSEPFPGAQTLVSDLVADGIACGVATSKPQDPAVLVINHLGWGDHFIAVAGANPERRTKAECIRECLLAMSAKGVDTSRPVIVGDRHHDIDGARDCGIDAVFVTWGYGGTAESLGATLVVDSFEELGGRLIEGYERA